jgi:AraC family transcriptional regulator
VESASIEWRGNQAMSDHSETLATQDPMREIWAQELSVVAAQFVEAACTARNGDPEATRAHVAHALALLKGLPNLGPSTGTHRVIDREARVTRGGLPAWQARRISTHIEDNISARIHIKQLARLVGLSAGHFCRAFKSSFGVSPRDYVLRRRIEVAQALMLTTPAPLSAISVSCGMCDQQHFTRSFGRIVGESPSSGRRARLGVLQIKQVGGTSL